MSSVKNASVDIFNFCFEAHFAEATPGVRAVGQLWIVSVSSDLDYVVPILNLSIYHLFTFYWSTQCPFILNILVIFRFDIFLVSSTR